MQRFVIILFLTCFLNAQSTENVRIEYNGVSFKIPYKNLKGIEYVSSENLSKVFGGTSYFNKQTGKIELKFSEFNLKFTGRNQFLSLVDPKNKTQSVFQLPISTLLTSNDILVPLVFVIEYLAKATNTDITFNKNDLLLTVKSINQKSLVTKEPIKDLRKEEKEKPSNNELYDIYEATISEKSNGTLISLKTKGNVKRINTSITNNILFVFIYGNTVNPILTENLKPIGLVKNIKQKKIGANIQLEFYLKEGYSGHDRFEDDESGIIQIAIHNSTFKTEPTEENLNKEKWLLDAIVIDAGHGGKDPGAIGVNKVREKDVNLSIALKLGDLIKKKLPEVKVIYTRKTDVFIELYKRGQIANENNGKLFISIHCNSLAQKPSTTRGFEVYLLKPGRDEEAVKIAEFENSVIELEDNPKKYKELTNENFILVSMAHAAHMRYSETFSDLLNQNWKKFVDIPSRGIKQAGFYVLVGASMPSVLIETGFLSNPTDEAYLKSKKGQQDVSNAIYKAIVDYKKYYEQQIISED